MRKQVRTFEEHMVCEVCGRTMLKGESTEPYLTPSRERKLVCQLCAPRAQQEGWIRESANPGAPARPPQQREGGRRFLRARKSPMSQDDAVHQAGEGSVSEIDGADGVPPGSRRAGRRSRFRRDPRHVRAVPTNAQLKLERAIELFNVSEHPRTVAGIARALGLPHVSASTSDGSPAEVVLTVAWDISWYQFVVDLSDTRDPVRMEARGEELGELRPEARDWNGSAEADGRLALAAAPASSDGEEREQVL